MHSTDALCAVLHQLFTQDITSGLIRKALSGHRNYGKAFTQNFSELWRILIKCARSSDAENVGILDALDECYKTSRIQFIEKLKEFYYN